MRFTHNGPSLPDNLLVAHDAGDVLFFCGAGVSLAQANLPSFVSLASTVLASLGSSSDSPARKLFTASRKFEQETRLTGLVATDRIFGLLEREFDPKDVRAAVAAALRPAPGAVLDAHRTMLKLSTNPTGATRLVTTNFDLLFEQCDDRLEAFSPPHLPDPSRDQDFRGIVHLHGRVGTGYDQAVDDEFVLSSADFGHAYLSDGWAARYIQKLLQRYTIVFVGYSAEDPPVQYLLEALNRFSRGANPMYAFQAGAAEQALAQWSHKGVVPVPFDASNNFEALWGTLGAWADRASDPEKWHQGILTMAKDGPTAVAPHQRGQLVHVVGTELGASLLMQAKVPAPAEWLITLDDDLRAAGVRRIGNVRPEDDDPYIGYEPDDCTPLEGLPAALAFHKPPSLKDLVESKPTVASMHDEPSTTAVHLNGPLATQAPPLSMRLFHVSCWIAAVADQHAALWWASRQDALHPTTRSLIERETRHRGERFAPNVRRAWRMLSHVWGQPSVDPLSARYEIADEARAEGWSQMLVRNAVALYQPRIEIERFHGDRPPRGVPQHDDEPVVEFDVFYPRPPEPFEFPDDLLPYVLEQLRLQLQHAVSLEQEVAGRDTLYFDTVRNDDGSPLDEDSYGIAGLLATYVNHLRRLIANSPVLARTEATMWSRRQDALFTHLRIWAAGQASLTSVEEASHALLNLPPEVFWGEQHERDLLISLRDRWADLPATARRALEERIVCERHPHHEEDDRRSALIAHLRLNRVHWLAKQGARMSGDLQEAVTELRVKAPDWTEKSLEHVAEPRSSQVYRVETNTEPAQLTTLPLGLILEETERVGKTDFFERVRRQPFRGLAHMRIRRAVSTLTEASRRGKLPIDAWIDVLQSHGPDASNARVLGVLSRRLARLAPDQLSQIAHPAAQWLLRHCKTLVEVHPEALEVLWSALVHAIETASPVPDTSAWQWAETAANRPAGMLVTVAIQLESFEQLEARQSLPESWKARIHQLLRLPEWSRPYAVARLAVHLTLLHYIDPEWTTSELLKYADDTMSHGQAFWSGFMRTPSLPRGDLFLALKPHLTRLALDEQLERRSTERLAAILLSQWQGDQAGDGQIHLTSDEFREILIRARNPFRVQVLQQLRVWSKMHPEVYNLVVSFLKTVWPRQLTARTPSASGELIDLALALPGLFADITDVVLPAIVPVASPSRIGLAVDSGKALAEQEPQRMLALLSAALNGHRISHVHGLDDLLRVLKEASSTRADPRLAELMRRVHTVGG